MKKLFVIILALGLTLAISNLGWVQQECATIQGGGLTDANGNPITTGYDEFGYNYQAHMFNGRYCDADRVIGGGPYCDVDLIMKWNEACDASINDRAKRDDGDGFWLIVDRDASQVSYDVTGHRPGALAIRYRRLNRSCPDAERAKAHKQKRVPHHQAGPERYRRRLVPPR